MKYVFILGIGYKPYKKNAEVDVKINDILLERKTLEKPIGYYKAKFEYQGSPISNFPKKLIKNPDSHIFNIETLKQYENKTLIESDFITQTFSCIEFDDKIFKEKNFITVTIRNNDNNYTNGFMTRWGFVTLYMIALVPKFMIDDTKILRKIRNRLDYSRQVSKRTAIDGSRETWPMNFKKFSIKYLSKKNTAPSRLNRPGAITQVPLGGSMEIKIPVIKKHKIYMIGDKKTKGFFDFYTVIDIYAEAIKGNVKKEGKLIPADTDYTREYWEQIGGIENQKPNK